MTKIFIVEDDIKIREELSLFLSRNGFKTDKSDDFKNIIDIIIKSNCDLILLDINLPFVDGYHICKEIRKQSNTPIIVVTSQDSDLDELMSINFGADDFVTKPYNTQILLARIQSILRRTQSEQKFVHVGEIKLQLTTSTLHYNNCEIELTKNELKILNVLMGKQGTIVSRDDIMETLWQSNEFIDDNTLTVNINRLRKKLEGYGIVDFLKTKRGQGYII